MTLPAPSTPIVDALKALGLTEAERDTILALAHVRTLGDLPVVLDRGEVTDAALAKKIKKALSEK